MTRDAETFLTRTELVRLTGKKYAPAQKRVLEARRIRFTEDDAGRPIVLRAAIEKKLLGEAVSAEPGQGPDFSAFPAVS